MIQRPVLIGMNSPQSVDPAMALYPWTAGATGGRILGMIRDSATTALMRNSSLKIPQTITDEDYLRVFDRRNLVNALEYDPSVAASNATQLKTQLRGRNVVLCGLSVLAAFGFQRPEWGTWVKREEHLFGDEFHWTLIPHPSGLTRDYNDTMKRKFIGDILFNLYLVYRLNEDTRSE